MNTRIDRCRRGRPLQVLAAMLLLAGAAFAQAGWETGREADATQGPGEAASLFGKWAEADDAAGVVGALPGRGRFVVVDRSALDFPNLHIELPGGERVVAVRDKQTKQGPDASVWIGRVPAAAGSQVILARHGEAVSGTLLLGSRLYKLVYRSAMHWFGEVQTHDPLPEGDPIAPADAPLPAFSPPELSVDEPVYGPVQGRADPLPAAAGDDGAIIDVLVAYTPAARAANGGSAGIRSLIDLAVAETNAAYANSAMTVRLRLVHAAEVDYADSGSLGTDLGRLADGGDGVMDEVHALREQYGADIVTLLVGGGDYCGLAYQMGTETSTFAAYAFNVVAQGCATGYYSFGHEIGHNQGAHHDRLNTGVPGVFPYAYAYQEPMATFRTVLAYDCLGGCVRVQHFSNPDVDYLGLPTGIDYELDPAHAADNARTIDATRVTVANFRQSIPGGGEVPAAPVELSAQTVAADRIDLLWSDAANDEDGFRIERADAQGAFREIADLPANTESFTDVGLAPATAYEYRVRAYNGVGNSAYSNLAGSTTHALPSAPTGLGIDALGADFITLSWDAAAADGIVGYRLYRDAVQIADTTATSYTDSPLEPATTYSFQVAAYDASAHDSPLSAPVAATTAALPIAADRIEILQATYREDRDELKIRANSSDEPDAVLSVEGYGEMVWKKDKYELKLRPLAPLPIPQTVTVRSSRGGVATAAVAGAPPPPVPGEAAQPMPADGSEYVPVAVELSWRAGADTDSHEVYFGTSPNPPLRGSRTEPTFVPETLAHATTYFWRIDEVNALGTTEGPLWHFTTEPEPGPPAAASQPAPAQGALDVAVATLLRWVAGAGAESHEVYFGTDPDPAFQGEEIDSAFDPGALDYETTYYWRIDEINALGRTRGPTWSFTTGTAVPADSVEITKAEWKAKDGEVKVTAASTSTPDAVLTLVGFGAMEIGRKDNYEFSEKGYENPVSVTVISDRGGTATAQIDVR